MTFDIPAQADGSVVTSLTDSAGAVFAAASGAPVYRTTGLGGKPYIQVATGDRLNLPVTSGAGAALKALVANGTFTVIAFMNAVVNTGNDKGAILGSYDNGPSLIMEANGQIAGIYQNTSENSPFNLPFTGNGMLSVAQVQDAAYPFKNGIETLTRVYLNGGCIRSSASTPASISTDGISLFGIQNGLSQGQFAGDYYGHLVFNRALQPAEIKQCVKWFCEQTTQPYPWAGQPATYTAFGNSLDNGYRAQAVEYSPMPIVATSMGLPLGAWDDLGVDGQSAQGMQTAVSADVMPIGAITGLPHRVSLGEYYNAVYGTGQTGPQVAQTLVSIAGTIKAASGTKVYAETPSASYQDRQASTPYATYDTFVATLTSSTAFDGFIRVDQDPNIGRAADDQNATYYSGDGIHLSGTIGTCGYRTKAALMQAAFTS